MRNSTMIHLELRRASTNEQTSCFAPPSPAHPDVNDRPVAASGCKHTGRDNSAAHRTSQLLSESQPSPTSRCFSCWRRAGRRRDEPDSDDAEPGQNFAIIMHSPSTQRSVQRHQQDYTTHSHEGRGQTDAGPGLICTGPATAISLTPQHVALNQDIVQRPSSFKRAALLRRRLAARRKTRVTPRLGCGLRASCSESANRHHRLLPQPLLLDAGWPHTGSSPNCPLPTSEPALTRNRICGYTGEQFVEPSTQQPLGRCVTPASRQRFQTRHELRA